ncbi:OLC1v1007314C1 [Oldenlandia corymbosa var. corymbosa]|uniref:OLC1v1007314C1 n=1 Tax=Oldenlandia corymbosa var. corymbosa TaxID=529605 RepID=A0AAV1DLL0_OLDCO|nr:OLC1v1007314C1 [Oldenlandia corymbosa var. corymbosa]
MSSTVCQGLQSCLEPKLAEPLILIQNLASPQISTVLPSSSTINPWPQMPNVSPPQHDNDDNNNYYTFLDSKHQKTKENGSFWSSITSQNSKKPAHSESDKLYVHPLVKRSSSTLSTKSLEMCTESLGSETGSSIGESIDDLPSGPLPERFGSLGRQKKIYRSAASYPPPLTSISGSEGVQMRPHREGGRLVLKAFSVTSSSPHFKTERSNGRLKLSLLRKEEEEEGNDDDFNDDVISGHELQVEEDQLAINADNEDELEVNDENNVGYEVGGVGEFPRPISSSRRCKEGGGNNRNKRIPSWEPFWVAIS